MLQKSQRQQESVIYLTGVSCTEMQSMVDFMYLGQTEIAQEDLEHFLEISAKFDVKGLSELPNNTTDTEETENNLLEVELAIEEVKSDPPGPTYTTKKFTTKEDT